MADNLDGTNEESSEDASDDQWPISLQSVFAAFRCGRKGSFIDDPVSKVTKALDEAIRKSFQSSEENSVNEELVDSEELIDLDNFTDDDFANICNDDEFSFLTQDGNDDEAQNENDQVPAVSTKNMTKISEFPLEPDEMTFEFCHEWTMICSDRRVELEEDLKERLESLEQQLIQETGENDVDSVKCVLNAKLATYAKRGMLEDVTGLIAQHHGQLDFLQLDKHGVTLLVRLCIWPCADKEHAYCKLMEMFASNYPDSSTCMNQKTYKRGTTALMIAARVGEQCKVNALLKAGAFVSTAGHDGRTALTLAAERGRFDIVVALLAHGANPSPCIINAPTAFLLANLNQHFEVENVLRNYYRSLSLALRQLCVEIVGNVIQLKGPITPIFCTNLRESSSFITEFMPEPEAYHADKDVVNLLFIACVRRDSNGKFRCRPADHFIKSVRLNGMQQESIMQNRETIDVVTFRTIRLTRLNRMKINFKGHQKNSKVHILIQGYACDVSNVLTELETASNNIIDSGSDTDSSVHCQSTHSPMLNTNSDSQMNSGILDDVFETENIPPENF